MRPDNKPIILTEKMIRIFNKHVWVRLSNQCWPWCSRNKNKDGRGRLTIHDDYDNQITEHYLASRVAYVITFGSFDWSLNINHSCDNPSCCNPTHLWLGTQQDGISDCVIKGRNRNGYVDNKGEKHGNTKLTEEQIIKIRFKAALGITQSDLAKEYNVSRPLISRIVNYEIWKHI